MTGIVIEQSPVEDMCRSLGTNLYGFEKIPKSVRALYPEAISITISSIACPARYW
jgi:hypothetical protein